MKVAEEVVLAESKNVVPAASKKAIQGAFKQVIPTFKIFFDI
jgi:hypothetical protein